jgi:hypothetical protein
VAAPGVALLLCEPLAGEGEFALPPLAGGVAGVRGDGLGRDEFGGRLLVVLGYCWSSAVG